MYALCRLLTSSLIANEKASGTARPMGWHLAKAFVEAGDASSVPLAAQASISGGSRPFGYRLGQVEGHGKARILIETEATQAAIPQMRTMRQDGRRCSKSAMLCVRRAFRSATRPYGACCPREIHRVFRDAPYGLVLI